MIKLLQNSDSETAIQIQAVFKSSYTVEAELLGADDFPPLKRPLESYQQSSNDFHGFFETNELVGVIEIEPTEEYIDINSLVVSPKFFRCGIGRKLVEFTFNHYESDLFIVETGVDNGPAITLYKKMGFLEVKQWDTKFGIRKVKFEKRVSK